MVSGDPPASGADMDSAKVGTYAARWLCAGLAVEHGWMDGWAWAAGMHSDLFLLMAYSCFALPQLVWTYTNNCCVFLQSVPNVGPPVSLKIPSSPCFLN